MDHIAIMQKKYDFINMILDGTKTIESRWYKSRRSPWNKLSKGDVIYFKNSGENITARAKVQEFTYIELRHEYEAGDILNEYGSRIGLDISGQQKYLEKVINCKYCILIFLKSPEAVEPFKINKKGFGNYSAWITVENINQIQIANS